MEGIHYQNQVRAVLKARFGTELKKACTHFISARFFRWLTNE